MSARIPWEIRLDYDSPEKMEPTTGYGATERFIYSQVFPRGVKRANSGLESRLETHPSRFRSSTHANRDHTLLSYRSESERIIAAILANEGIRFRYEDNLHIPQEYTGGQGNRIWYPDFHLLDSGILIEYAGMTHEKEYMKGVQRKKEVYDKMGITVIWLLPEDLWEETGHHEYGKLRDDAEKNVLRKIHEVMKDRERKARPYSSGFHARVLNYPLDGHYES